MGTRSNDIMKVVCEATLNYTPVILVELLNSSKPCFNDIRQFKYSGNVDSGRFLKLNDKAMYPIHGAYTY